MNIRKRLLSFFLAISISLSLLPVTMLRAQASDTDPNRIGAISDSTFDAMGFQTAAAKAQAEDLMKEPPTGTTPFPLHSFHELFVSTPTAGRWYDLDPWSAGTSYDPLGEPETKKSWDVQSSAGNAYVSPQAVKSVAFDPAGTGKDQYVAQVVAGKYGSFKNGAIGFILRVSNAETGAQTDTIFLQHTLFELDEFYIGAMLAIAAGDYDGDGKDEVAVYAPRAASGVADLVVEIYEVESNGKLTINEGERYVKPAKSKKIWEITTMGGVGLNNVYDYRTVSLATVKGNGTADSLAIAVGAPRSAAKSGYFYSNDSYSASQLSLWHTPLKNDDSVSRLSAGLSDSWQWAYGVQDEDLRTNRETMMYPGVAAGDIDGDGVAEIVVAGYRVSDKKGVGWKLDKDRMLITYYKLNENGTYDRSTSFQWIGMKEGDYLNAASLGDSLREYDLVHPPTVRIFAERGPMYNNSIFVNGVVVCLPTQVMDQETGLVDTAKTQSEYSRGMYPGTEKSPDSHNLAGFAPSLDKTLRICYVAPLRALDTTNGYRPGNSLGRRAVLDAAVGNFDGNSLGREQVSFTYGMQSTHITSLKALGTDLCILGFDAKVDEEAAKVGNKSYSAGTGYKNNLQNAYFSARYLGSGTRNSTAAVDADDDSVIVRYNNLKDPKYYFSDPQITAVLQAAPYFAELRSEMDAEPETSFAKIAGGEGEVYGSISVSAGIGFGLDVGVSGGVGASAEVFSASGMLNFLGELSGSLGLTASTETTQTFSTKWEDAVVLTMTPYAVHYYEEWDPTTKRWKEALVKVPGTPQMSKITVDFYDEMAKQQDWVPLRESVLDNAQAGDPSSYIPSMPKDIILADTEKDTVTSIPYPTLGTSFRRAGYGSGNTSVAVTNTAGMTTGVSMTGSVSFTGRVKVIAVALEAESSISVTAGLNAAVYAGTNLLASTPDIPSSVKNEYGFDWSFGARLHDLSANGDQSLTALVLNYMVCNVNAPPKPPADLEVESVGENAVTLSWTRPSGTTPFSYEMCRLVDGYYFPIGTVTPAENADEDQRLTFTDTTAQPGVTYTYAVRSNAYVSGQPRTSAYSDPVTITTLSPGSVSIQSHPKDTTVQAGGTATFAVTMSYGASGGADNAQYQWQQRQGADTWTDVTDALYNNQPVLTLQNVTDDMNGTQYRCQVRTINGALLSKTATLTVGNENTQTSITLTTADSSPTSSGKSNEITQETASNPATRSVGVNAIYKKDETYGETYTVVAQSITPESPATESTESTVTTNYYLEKTERSEDGSVITVSHYLPGTGEVTAEAIADAAKDSANSTAVTLQLKSEPQPITLNRTLHSADTLTDESPTSAAALNGTPAEKLSPLPYTLKTGNYQGYKSGEHTVYAVEPDFYFLKNGDTYTQLLLVESEPSESPEPDGFTSSSKFKFTTVNGSDAPGGVTPAILDRQYAIDPETETLTVTIQMENSAARVEKRTVPVDITFATTVTAACDYYEGSAATGNSYPAVAVAHLDGQTCYFTEGETDSFTRVYLKSAYTYGESSTSLADFDHNALLAASADVEITVTTLTQATTVGDAVTLTATVTPELSGDSNLGGPVVFEIVNTSASSVETLMATVSDKDQTATRDWTPPQPGVYEITAIYQGSNGWNGSRSDPATYTAYLENSGWLALNGYSTTTYGDSVTLDPKFHDNNGDITGTTMPVTYKVTKDGTDVTAKTINSNTFTPSSAGTFVITASYTPPGGSTYTAVKTISVAKRAVTVRVNDLQVTSATWRGLILNNKLKPSGDTLTIKDGPDIQYDDFALSVDTRGAGNYLLNLGAGQYFITVDGARNEDGTYTKRFQTLSETYAFTFQRGTLDLAPNTIEVTFRAEEQGTLRAWFGSSEITSPSRVNEKTEVRFAASPKTGYVVDKWTILRRGYVQTDESSAYDGKANITLLTHDSFWGENTLDVTVSFKEQTFAVSYGATPAHDGTLTAFLNDADGAKIASGTQMAAGAKVHFVAQPEDGRYLTKWTVNGLDVRINGKLHTDLTYTIDKLEANAAVQAHFSDERTFTVTAAAVDENGDPAGLMGSVSVSPNPADGSYMSGTQVTLTATPGTDYQVAEWRSYTGDDYTVLQGNMLTYTLSNLRQNWDIRVVFSGQKTHHVTYGPVSGTADAGGVVTTNVASGSQHPAGSPLTFTAVANTGMELSHWLVNGEIRQATGNTYHIPALNADVDVQAVFLTKPTITTQISVDGTEDANGCSVEVKADNTPVQLDGSVPYGSEVTVTLKPAATYEVTGLTVGGVDVLANARYTDDSGATTDERVYTFPATQRGEYAIVASFSTIPSATVNVSFSSGDGHPQVSGVYVRKGVTENFYSSGPSITAYRDGVVTLTAEPDPDNSSRFTGWTLNRESIGDSSTTLTLPITAELIEKGKSEGESESKLNVMANFDSMGSNFFFDVQGKGQIVATLNGETIGSNYQLASGTTVNLTVTPDEGWELDAWLVNNEVQPNEKELTFTYTSTGSGAYVVARLKREVKVTFGGENGTVTAEANGAALETGDTVPYGTLVTFRAFPDPAHVLASWGDAAEGTANPLILTATDDLDVTAQFLLKEDTAKITFANPTNGELTATRGGATFTSGGKAKPGDVIVFTVEPTDDGYAVSGWSNNGAPVTGERDSTYSLTVTGDHDIAVALVPAAYAVHYSVDGTGGTINGKPSGSLDVAPGEKVTLTAAPDSGQMVGGWYLGDSDTALPGSRGQNTYVIDAVNRDITVKVKFVAEATHTLTITHDGTGAGTVKASVNGGAPQAVSDTLAVRYGDTVVLTATPQNGYSVFGGWSEAAQDAALLSDSLSLGSAPSLNLGAITANKTIIATFNAQAQVNLHVVWNRDSGHQTVSGVTGKAGYDTLSSNFTFADPGSVDLIPGQKVELTATPNEAGSGKVAQWRVNGAVQPKLQNTLTIDSLTQKTSIWVDFTPGVTITINQPTGGTISVKAGDTTLQSGDVVPADTGLSLTATANANYKFESWGGDASSLTGATGTLNATGTALTISATFASTGGGGGNGGGGGGTPPTPVTPPTDDDKTVIDDKTGDQLVDDAEKNGGDIKIDADKPAVSLPSGLLSDAGGKTSADILITTPVAAIRLPNGALGDLASLGGEITVQATLDRSTDGQQMLTLNITADGKTVGSVLGGVKVTVPYTGGTVNTVAMLPNGSILPKSFALDGQMTVPLAGPAAVVLTDNPKDFLDTTGHWGETYIDFAASHGLFQGVAEGVFDANGTMTRAMLWTVLARLEGADTTGGSVWYEKGLQWAQANGISDGTNPDGAITREQLATMLWRVAGEPASDGSLDGFNDAHGVSNYAAQALHWAIEQGIVTGKGSGLLDPTGSATRAEVSAMFMRFICKL